MNRKSGELPDSALLRINALCERFERAWQEGQRPRIEALLEDLPEQERVRPQTQGGRSAPFAFSAKDEARTAACRRPAGEITRP
jgi:hypothetical protein